MKIQFKELEIIESISHETGISTYKVGKRL